MGSGKEALIIIDMQNDFVLPGAPACVTGARATVPRIKKLLEHFRERRQPIFHVTREYRADGSDVELNRLGDFRHGNTFVVPGTPGCQIVDGLMPLPGEYRVIKQRFSAFMQTELDFMLRRLGVTRLVVCGTQYPNCVRATIFDAICYGYAVLNVTDASSAQTADIAEANIRDLRNVGVECLTLEAYLERRPTWA